MGLAEAILDEFGQDLKELTLIPSSGGVLEVTVDGETVFSKKQLGRHPTVKEIKEILRGRVK